MSKSASFLLLGSMAGTVFAQTAEVSATSLLIVGDWGGMDFKPYYSPGQLATASGMDSIGSKLKASAVISLGDNFYGSGIYTDEYAHRFEDTWNAVYTGDSLQVPWYMIGGNHDHYGNITAEIEYSSHSDRWTFPNIYHSKSFASPDGATMDIIFIDTIDLAGNTVTDNEEDPRYYDPLPFKSRSDAAEQWSWIEDQLQASTADYLMVAGHYPVYSVCEHGNTQNLLDNLRPMLIQYGAHYMAGHDHCM
jgi:tartrate-resistant acid phosphatase type 5